MSLNVYLNFAGNCREAFEFYRAAFGGEFSRFSTYADGPPGMTVPDAERDWVMHVSLPVGETVLMGSDVSSAFGPPPTVGDNVSISILGESREHCDAMFAKLSDGGTPKMAPQDMFWGAYFGMWTDRFGIHWMINYELPQA